MLDKDELNSLIPPGQDIKNKIDDAREELINAAINWRIADEAEPIPSDVVKEKMTALALAIDAYLNCQPGLRGALLNNYKVAEEKTWNTYLIQSEIDLLRNSSLEATYAYMKRTGNATKYAERVVYDAIKVLEDGYTLKPFGTW